MNIVLNTTTASSCQTVGFTILTKKSKRLFDIIACVNDNEYEPGITYFTACGNTLYFASKDDYTILSAIEAGVLRGLGYDHS